MPSREIRIAGVLISIGLAWLTYMLIENPIRRSSNNKRVLGLMIGMILIFAIGALTYLNDGLVNRNAKVALQRLDDQMVELSRTSDKSCLEKINLKSLPEEVCLTNSNSPKILFVGDSHAMAVYSAISAGRFSIPSMMISAHSCPLYANLEYTPTYKHTWDNNCTAIAKESLRFAESNVSISTVIMSNAALNIEVGTESRYRKDGLALDAYSAFIEGNKYYIGELLKSGKSVVYMIDVPFFKYKPIDCKRRQAPDCQIDEYELINSRTSYMKAIQELQMKFPKLKIFDSTSVFCKNGICSEEDNGGYLYQDNQHLNIYGSEKVLNLLMTNKFID